MFDIRENFKSKYQRTGMTFTFSWFNRNLSLISPGVRILCSVRSVCRVLTDNPARDTCTKKLKKYAQVFVYNTQIFGKS